MKLVHILEGVSLKQQFQDADRATANGDRYKNTTPTVGKHAARNDHKLGKTSTNPWNKKYHKDTNTQSGMLTTKLNSID